MAKKILILLLAAAVMASFAACHSTQSAGREKEGNANENWKIGIITGPASLQEEAFRAAEQLKAKYGEHRIVTATYPDSFYVDAETVAACMADMAADKDVEAIVFMPAIPGAASAIDEVRKTRPDMLFVCGTPGEDPCVICASADIVLDADEAAMSEAVARQAADLGAGTFVYYSFPRHGSYAPLSARHDVIEQTCEEHDVEFVDAVMPDPLGDEGAQGAQRFLLDDIPRMVELYGRDTAFFCTDCGMQELLIACVLELGAICPQSFCPSPYSAYLAALGIDVTSREGEAEGMLRQIEQKVIEAGNAGRMSCWTRPVEAFELEIGVRYAEKWITGETDGRVDAAALASVVQEISGEGQGAGIRSSAATGQDEAETGVDNCFLLLCGHRTFGEADAAQHEPGQAPGS